MKLYLIRHGESKANEAGDIIQGQFDSDLSEIGIEQAQKVGQRLKDHSFDRIYASDLQRAFKTAQAIAEHHTDTPFHSDKRLREICHGDYQGRKKEEVGWQDLPFDQWLAKKAPQGENYVDVVERIKEFYEGLEKEGTVLLVGHGGTIKSMLHVIMGYNIEEAFSQKTGNTCIYIIDLSGDKPVIELENCTKHLD